MTDTTDTDVRRTAPKSFWDKTTFEQGMQHYLEGVPRNANPCLIAVSARKPLQHPRVLAWWAGWDTARTIGAAQK